MIQLANAPFLGAIGAIGAMAMAPLHPFAAFNILQQSGLQSLQILILQYLHLFQNL